MATVISEILVRIGADLKGFQKGTEEVGKSLAAISDRLGKWGKTLSVAVTTPLLAAGGAAIKTAMDAVESENLFSVSMGKMADAARAWSKELSKALGLSEYELRRNIGTFNVMFKSMGLGEKAAYDMSKSLVQLAYDMASFYNLRPDEAFEKLRAGITGEVEPLKRLGIVLNETTIQTYAYTHGIAKQGEELNEVQKIMARYGALMEQTSAAQGDLARTIESPANQLRILQARLSDAAITLGTNLLPAFTQAVQAANRLAEGFAGLSPEAQKTVIAVGGLAAATGPVLIGLSKVIQAAQSLRSAFAALGNITTFLTGPFGLILAAVTALAGGFLYLRSKADDAEQSLRSHVAAAAQQVEANRKALETLEKQAAGLESLAQEYVALTDKLKKVKAGTEEEARVKADLIDVSDRLRVAIGNEGIARLQAAANTAAAIKAEVQMMGEKVKKAREAYEESVKYQKAETVNAILQAQKRIEALEIEGFAQVSFWRELGANLQSWWYRLLAEWNKGTTKWREYMEKAWEVEEQAVEREKSRWRSLVAELGQQLDLLLKQSDTTFDVEIPKALQNWANSAGQAAGSHESSMRRAAAATDQLTAALQTLDLNHKFWLATAGQSATEAEKAAATQELLRQKMALVSQELEAAKARLAEVAAAKGINSQAAMALKQRIVELSETYADLKKQVQAATEAMKEQIRFSVEAGKVTMEQTWITPEGKKVTVVTPVPKPKKPETPEEKWEYIKNPT